LTTLSENTLARSAAIQRRVIGALLLREAITRYGRHGFGVLWIILEPALFTLGVAGLWYLVRGNAVSNMPVVAFAITGYSSVLMWRNTTNRCSKAIESNRPLMYHRNVNVLDIFLARIVLEWVGATASIAVLTILFASVGAMEWPQDPWPIIGGWLLMAWFSLGLGLIVGALSEYSETVERTWPIATYLLFPLSGAVFMVHWLPPAAREAVLWLPMVHGVEMIRHGYFGDLVPTYGDPVYFSCANLVLMLIGLALAREASRRVRTR
jgi:capsular polysaccharide transport system permease protein